MRIAISSILLAVFLVGHALSSAGALAAEDSAVKVQPRLDKADFADRLSENFRENAPEEVTKIYITSRQEMDFILDNLAHLPALTEIDFSGVKVTEADFAKIAQFENITQIHFNEYRGFDLLALSAVKSLQGVSFFRCTQVPWTRLPDMKGPSIRRIKIFKTPLNEDDLRALGRIVTLETLELSESEGLDDKSLRTLATRESLRSLTIYNCSTEKGDFIQHLTDLKNLREFKYTGPLSVENALKLAEFAKLETIALNLKIPLPETWYQAIAENCPNLRQLRLFDQVLDKAKVERLLSLGELTELAVYSDMQIPDMSMGGPRATTELGVFEKLSRLKKLEKLHLSRGYRFNAADGAAIASLENLKQLQLWNVRFAEGALKDLGRLTKLTDLSLYGCQGLGAADAQGIGKLASLEQLDLRQFRKASDSDFSHLKGLGNLRKLDVRYFRDLNDHDMGMFAGMKRLEDLSMRDNWSVSDEGIVHLRHATNLNVLNLTKMSIHGTGFAAWPTDHGIESIFIEGTAITNDGLKAISRLKNLVYLDVRLLRLFGPNVRVEMDCFISTPSLEAVSMIGNYVTTPESLNKLTEARPDLEAYCPTE